MQIRDRIKELRRVKASELRPNPKNWRKHPDKQRKALRAVLQEVGVAAAGLAYVADADKHLGKHAPLTLIDGHLRSEELETQPVLVLDVTDAEAAKLLVTLDPLTAMAESDAGQLDELLREVQTGDEALAKMLADLAEEAGILGGESELRPVSVSVVPKMSWVLVGCPATRFGEISAAVESIAAVPGIVCEVVVEDVKD